MPFAPGQSGNAKGRRPGSKNRKTVYAEMAYRQLSDTTSLPTDLDPMVFLKSVVSHRQADAGLRVQASSVLMPYLHSRRTVRRVTEPVDLPVPASVQDATANLAKLSALAAAGAIGLDEAADLAGLQRSYIEARIGLDAEAQLAELRQLVQQLNASAGAVFGVTIRGGMPRLPGTAIDLPHRNGDDPETGPGE
jgi:Family of unknown function (DUF5681)